MIENPMISPLTSQEEIDMMSEDDIRENTIECNLCGEELLKMKAVNGMHDYCNETERESDNNEL